MSVQLELDKPRTLRFDLEALGDMEDKVGKPLVLAYVDLLRRGINVTAAFLWTGLRHEDKPLTFNLARKLLQDHLKNGGKFQVVTDAIESALKESGVLDKDEPEGNAAPEPAS